MGSMSQPQAPPRIWQLVLGFANTAVLHALVKTGVIEALRAGPRRLAELAHARQLNADVLYRALRYAAVVDVVTQDGEQYALTETGRMLLEDVPGSLYMALLLGGSEPWQRAWQNLTHALTTGDNAFEQAMGARLFDYLDRHPEYGAPYNRWMTLSTSMAARASARCGKPKMIRKLKPSGIEISGGRPPPMNGSIQPTPPPILDITNAAKRAFRCAKKALMKRHSSQR